MLVRGLRVTPFSYYSNVMFDIMSNEKSYDSLPNFTAADGSILIIWMNILMFFVLSCPAIRSRQEPVHRFNEFN